MSSPEDYMCPNCVTPWKCNGPHIPDPSFIGEPPILLYDAPEDRERLIAAIPSNPQKGTIRTWIGDRQMTAAELADLILAALRGTP